MKKNAIALSTVAIADLKAIGNPVVTLPPDNRVATKAYALFSKDGKFAPFECKRHPVGDNDVLIGVNKPNS